MTLLAAALLAILPAPDVGERVEGIELNHQLHKKTGEVMYTRLVLWDRDRSGTAYICDFVGTREATLDIRGVNGKEIVAVVDAIKGGEIAVRAKYFRESWTTQSVAEIYWNQPDWHRWGVSGGSGIVLRLWKHPRQ